MADVAALRRALLLGALAQRGAAPRPAQQRPQAMQAALRGAVAAPSTDYRRASLAHQQTAFDPQAQHGPISWGNQWFGTPEQVVAWMNARGAGTNINRFYANHPQLAALFGQRQAAAQPAQPSLLAKLTMARAARPAQSRPPVY